MRIHNRPFGPQQAPLYASARNRGAHELTSRTWIRPIQTWFPLCMGAFTGAIPQNPTSALPAGLVFILIGSVLNAAFRPNAGTWARVWLTYGPDPSLRRAYRFLAPLLWRFGSGMIVVLLLRLL
jgi:hypothetical protein